ncbi:MAG: hypothetical protein H0U46_05025 [Actinobacteria bacterium]|nr:hypothetical protein [Actinomycetota bacterium]
MNTTIPLPSARYLGVMCGVLLLAVLFLVARPVLLGEDGGSAAPSSRTTTPAQTPSTPPASSRPAPKPRVVLLPGLPSKVANKLRHSKVLVLSLYQGNAATDRSAVSAAAAGARAVRAGYLAVNVLNENSARLLQTFVGTTSTPTVVVVRRPGRIVTRLEGAASADAQLVSQAAVNAGARQR